MSGRLNGKLALVTGGSRGIGEAIARAFAAEGARVVITSRKQDALDEVAAAINADHPGAVTAMACHVGDPSQLAALLARVEAELGVPDVLVNNAATNPYFGPAVFAPPWAFEKTFAVNVQGPFELTRQLASKLVAAGKPGSVINITSVFGITAAPTQALYGMTKAAIISMTRSLAVELGGAAIRVNAVAPGLIETKFSAAMLTAPEIVRRYNERAALGRYGQPEEVVGAVVFLASDEASFTTGQVLTVDGGYTTA